MQERVAVAVQVEQARPEGNVAQQLCPLGDPELAQAILQRRLHGALPADDQPPAIAAAHEARQHVGQQQGVLLGLQPADADHPQLAPVGAFERRLGGNEVLLRSTKETVISSSDLAPA